MSETYEIQKRFKWEGMVSFSLWILNNLPLLPSVSSIHFTTEILLAKVIALEWGYNSVIELTEHKQGSGFDPQNCRCDHVMTL